MTVLDLIKLPDRPSETKRFKNLENCKIYGTVLMYRLRVYVTVPKETCVYAGSLKETCVYTPL